MISVILPTYERADAVLCALAGLERQTYRDFETILVDDSDGDAVQMATIGANVRYIRSSPPRVGSFTAGRARNVGAANARGALLVFIDQDVILAPDALGHYARAYERHGDDVVVVGLYHWLPRMDFGPDDVRRSFTDVWDCAFGNVQKFPHLPMDEPGIQGLDFREQDFSADVDALVDDAALGCLSGNIGYPRKLFMALGGFDEAINRHGGEDADLGLTAKEHGAKFLQYRPIWGVHRWHTRDQKQNREDVQANIDYIDRKHGIGKYADAKKWMDARDWADPRHYHKDVGGVLMQANGDSTIWVCRDKHRLGLPTPDWIKRLGFKSGDVLMVPSSALNEYDIEGALQ